MAIRLGRQYHTGLWRESKTLHLKSNIERFQRTAYYLYYKRHAWNVSMYMYICIYDVFIPILSYT
jgi:hypothetical protein